MVQQICFSIYFEENLFCLYLLSFRGDSTLMDPLSEDGR